MNNFFMTLRHNISIYSPKTIKVLQLSIYKSKQTQKLMNRIYISMA